MLLRSAGRRRTPGAGRRALRAEKCRCVREMRRIIAEQRLARPLLNEEDIVKLAFQGMLGVGHLIADRDGALAWLHREMENLPPAPEEPLIEWLSPMWFRLNLRPARARGLREEEITRLLLRSAGGKLLFSRREVYRFCVELDGSKRMRAAAAPLLDGHWLPSHSAAYRAAYHPAYRVLCGEFGESMEPKP